MNGPAPAGGSALGPSPGTGVIGGALSGSGGTPAAPRPAIISARSRKVVVRIGTAKGWEGVARRVADQHLVTGYRSKSQDTCRGWHWRSPTQPCGVGWHWRPASAGAGVRVGRPPASPWRGRAARSAAATRTEGPRSLPRSHWRPASATRRARMIVGRRTLTTGGRVAGVNGVRSMSLDVGGRGRPAVGGDERIGVAGPPPGPATREPERAALPSRGRPVPVETLTAAIRRPTPATRRPPGGGRFPSNRSPPRSAGRPRPPTSKKRTDRPSSRLPGVGVGRVVRLLQAGRGDVRVDLRGRQVRVAQQFLHAPQVGPAV